MAEESTQTLEQRAPWVVSFPTSVRGEDMVGWGKTSEEVATTVRNTFKERDTLKADFEKLKSEPRIKPLGPTSKPEDIASYRKAFGVPDRPDGYQYRLADGMPPDVLDQESQRKFLELAHKHNVPQSVVKELLDFEVSRAVESRKAMAEVQNTKARELAEKLASKYGDQAQSKIDAAMKAVEAFGSPELRRRIEDKDHPDPVGNDPDVLNLLINIGALVTERGLMPGASGTTASGNTVDMRGLYPKSYADGHMM